MLDKLLQTVGFDLQAQIAQVFARASAMKEAAKQEVRAEITHIGKLAAFALAAFLALAGTAVIALIALYTWLKPEFGAPVSLAIVGGITGVFGVAMAIATATRKPPPPVAVPRPVVSPHPLPAPPVNVAAMVAPLPANASVFEVFTHRISSRAAGAADGAIDAAEEAIAHGSRAQLVGTIAAVVLVGWIVGRRDGI